MFKKKAESVVNKCSIRLLDDENILEYEFLEIHKGNYLLDQLCHQLELKEKDYFGLRYVDAGNQRQWLDSEKLVIKQCKDVYPLIFSFRIKFYPADPFHLSTNVRALLYKQLKRDLMHGRLYCSNDEVIALGALIVQEELGDYNPNVHINDYMFNIRLSIKQTDEMEKKIVNKHMRRNPGQDAIAAIDEFLRIARSIDTYGIEPNYVKDQQNCQIYIGTNFSGISTFYSGKRSQHFRWRDIRKLNFEGRMFIVHTAYTDASREVKKLAFGFKCTSSASCRYLWRCAIEHMLFFTLPNCQNTSVKYGGGIFSRGAKFKYSGRTEREMFADVIYSSDSKTRKKSNSLPTTPSSPEACYIRYSSLPRSGISSVMGNITTAETFSYDQNNFLSGNEYYPGSENRCMPKYKDLHANMDNNFTINSYKSYGSLAQEGEVLACASKSQRGSNKQDTTSFYRSYSFPENKNGEGDWSLINRTKKLHKFHLCRSFLPSLAFVVFTMMLFVILIFESSLEIFDCIRLLPEIMSLKDEYYAPIKKFLQDTNMM